MLGLRRGRAGPDLTACACPLGAGRDAWGRNPSTREGGGERGQWTAPQRPGARCRVCSTPRLAAPSPRAPARWPWPRSCCPEVLRPAARVPGVVRTKPARGGLPVPSPQVARSPSWWRSRVSWSPPFSCNPHSSGRALGAMQGPPADSWTAGREQQEQLPGSPDGLPVGVSQRGLALLPISVPSGVPTGPGGGGAPAAGVPEPWNGGGQSWNGGGQSWLSVGPPQGGPGQQGGERPQQLAASRGCGS